MQLKSSVYLSPVPYIAPFPLSLSAGIIPMHDFKHLLPGNVSISNA